VRLGPGLPGRRSEAVALRVDGGGGGGVQAGGAGGAVRVVARAVRAAGIV
jgi:hypothetical protein